MRYISVDELLELHALVIARFGGSVGVRDIGRLESAVATQSQQIFGAEIYSTVFEKAAAMMRGIIADHPFFDGNKRTGTLTALTLLELNGVEFVAKKGELEDFAVAVATDHLDVPDITEWLRGHSRTRPD